MTSTAHTPHQILGVPETATQDEIRRAYRRQALRHHPDRNPGDPTAMEAFIAVREAYEALAEVDPDAGFDAERVVAEMQQAAREVARRRARAGDVGAGWQQVRVALDRPRADLVAARLRTARALVGIGGGAVLAVSVGVALVVAAIPAVWAAVGGVGVGAAVASWFVSTAPVALWAVETRRDGLWDWRWNVLLRQDEVQEVEEGEGWLDLRLTAAATERLRALVPASAFAGPDVYRLPLAGPPRLAALIRSHLDGQAPSSGHIETRGRGERGGVTAMRGGEPARGPGSHGRGG